MRSILCYDSKNNALNDEDLKSRNKKNSNAADYLSGEILNKIIIKNVSNFYPSAMSNEELNYCKYVTSKKEHFKKERTVEVIDLIDSKNVSTKIILARHAKVIQHSSYCFLDLCNRNINLSYTKNLMPGEFIMKLKMARVNFFHFCKKMNVSN